MKVECPLDSEESEEEWDWEDEELMFEAFTDEGGVYYKRGRLNRPKRSVERTRTTKTRIRRYTAAVMTLELWRQDTSAYVSMRHNSKWHCGFAPVTG
jgi:hypothetical protein